MQPEMLTGYRMMWMLVMFDLPVTEPEERAAATRFRNSLLDLGFEMAQFSVYLRYVGGKEAAEAMTKKVEASTPPAGEVQILFFTDKQYEKIVTIKTRARQPANQNPSQFTLF
jgi:CRISPR-associated protein Cas2